jgi:hypothetical protein
VAGLTMGIWPVTTRGCEAGEGFREDGPDRWVLAVSVGGAVTEGRSGSCVEMGRRTLQRWGGVEKTARDPFFNLISFC